MPETPKALSGISPMPLNGFYWPPLRQNIGIPDAL